MRKNDLFSTAAVTLFSAALIGSIAMFFVFLARSSEISSRIESECRRIDDYSDKNKVPFSEETVEFLKRERETLEDINTRFKSALETPLGEEVRPEDLDPLKFKEKLVQTQKKLRKDAEARGLKLPSSLGFAKYETELSAPSEIPELMRRLKILEEITDIVISSGAGSLAKINFAENSSLSDKAKSARDPKKTSRRAPRIKTAPAPKAAEKKPETFYENIFFSFEIKCTGSKLMDLLYLMRASRYIFVVEDLDIKSAKDALDSDEAAERMLSAALSARAVIVN